MEGVLLSIGVCIGFVLSGDILGCEVCMTGIVDTVTGITLGTIVLDGSVGVVVAEVGDSDGWGTDVSVVDCWI